MTTKSIKRIISNISDCKPYINYTNTFISEPIMTKDKHNNIIDNFFVFSMYLDHNKWYVKKPEVEFSVDIDSKSVIKKNKNLKKLKKASYLDTYPDTINYKKVKEHYDFSYQLVRRMYENDIRRDQKIIDMYLDTLKCLSGEAVYEIDKILYPEFFNWATNKEES